MYKTINELDISTTNILNFYNQFNYYLINKEETMYTRIVNLVNESEEYLKDNKLESSLENIKKAKNLVLTLNLNAEQNKNILDELNIRIDDVFFKIAKLKTKK